MKVGIVLGALVVVVSGCESKSEKAVREAKAKVKELQPQVDQRLANYAAIAKQVPELLKTPPNAPKLEGAPKLKICDGEGKPVNADAAVNGFVVNAHLVTTGKRQGGPLSGLGTDHWILRAKANTDPKSREKGKLWTATKAAKEYEAFLRLRYVAVVGRESLEEPTIVQQGTNLSFLPGKLSGRVLLFDLTDGKCLGSIKVTVGNSEETMKFRSRGEKDRLRNAKRAALKDLKDRLETGTLEALNNQE